jgi:hypothetical protein
VAPLELRPRSATEIVDAAFQMLRQTYAPLVTLSVAAQLPALAIRISMGQVPTDPAQMMQWLSEEHSWALLGLLTVVALIGQNAVMVAASQLYLGEKMNAGAAFMRSLMRILPLIVAYLLAAFAVMLGYVALIIPGIWLTLRFIPLNLVTVLEDGGPIKAINRTWELGRGHIGHMFVTLFLAGLIYIGVALVGGVAVGLLSTVASLFKDSSVAAVLSTAVSAAIFPLFITIQVILYYDLRIRFEGFDVEMMSRDLGAAVPQPRS